MRFNAKLFQKTSPALAVLQVLEGEWARRCESAIERGSFTDLLSLYDEYDPRIGSPTLRDDWLAVNLLRKADFLPLGVDRKAEAVRKFRAAEHACEEANIRLLRSYDGPTCIGGPSVESVIMTARQKIARLVGEFNFSRVTRFVGFSAGASSSLPRRLGDPFYKCQVNLESTPSNMPLALAFIKCHPGWVAYLNERYGSLESAVRPIAGNVLETVPKNAKTDRMIAKEPSMNMYVQRGIGGLLRRLLRKVNIDLNDQSRNADLARLGALHGHLATLDLSAASDSVSVGICELLLPSSWMEGLQLCRSHYGYLEGRWHRYSKISSMGNGFTFELESLIFWALSESVAELLGVAVDQLAVYGDDIIVPVPCVPLLIKVLNYCGFSLNREKSFWTGYFRESCGSHYYKGVDVTPFYVQKNTQSRFRTMWLANSLRRWAYRAYEGYNLDNRVRPAYDWIVSQLKPNWRRPRIPDGVGDGALFGALSEVLPSYSLKRGAFLAHHLVPVQEEQHVEEWPGLFRYFHNTEERSSELEQVLTRPDFDRKMVCQTIYLERWADTPCWG